MKKIILSAISLFISSNIFSQILFQQVYHKDSLMLSVTNVDITYDNGYVLAGTVSDYQLFGGGPGDIFILRMDSAGNMLWFRRWDLGNDEDVFSMLATQDSSYIVTGFTFGASTLSRDGFILKADDAGNLVWVNRVDHNSASNTFHSIRPTEDKFILSGRSAGGTGGQYDMYMCLADNAGNILWGRTYGGSNWDWGWWADVTADDGFIMTGESQSFGLGSNDIYFVKTDNQGNKQWSKVYGGPDFEKGLWTKEVGGNYFIAGYTQGFVPANTDAKAFLMKIDTAGSVLWFKIYAEMSEPDGVFATPDGGFLLIGGSYNIPVTFGTFDMYLVKVDASGNVQWSRNYGGTSSESGTSVCSAPGGLLLGGSTYSFSAGMYSQAYLVKTDTAALSGCNDVAYSTTVYSVMPSTITPEDSVSSGFTSFTEVSTVTMPLLQRNVLCYSPVITETNAMNTTDYSVKVFPNPATEELVVGSSGPGEKILIEIYDALGQRIFSQQPTARSQKLFINVSSLQSGIYFVKMKTDKGISAAKFVKE